VRIALADAIVERVVRVGAGASAFLAELRVLGPDRLAAEPWEAHWDGWWSAARAVLADEMGRTCCVRDTPACATLAKLAGEPSYLVRRSAYRALAALDPPGLRARCLLWLGSEDVGVRKRAAEACCWVEPDDPTAEVDDEAYGRASTDPEKRVREAAERCLEERRERMSARAYLERVLAVATSETPTLLEAWPYGEALKRLGDDETMYRLWDLEPGAYLPPNVRHWRQRIHEAVEKRWRDAQGKWPKDWAPREMPEAG